MIIEKSRLMKILALSVPIIGGMVSQNLMSLIDTAMVGQLGVTALAGVGVGNFLFLLFISILMGIGAGVQAMVARRKGEGHAHLIGLPLNAGLLISGIVGVILTLIGFWILPHVILLVNQDSEVTEQGISYLMLRIFSITFVGFSISFRSYWTGIGKPKMFMISLWVLAISNVIFNYVFIFGHLGFPKMGTAGAGLGTALATFVSFLINLFFGLKYARINGFLSGLPDRERILILIKVSLPDSIRQFLFFLGLVVFFGIVGQIGTKEVAAFNVIINIMLVALLPAMGMGMTALTLVGHALGRKQPKDAKRWGWEVAGGGASVLILFGIVVNLFPTTILGVFLIDPETIQIATLPLRLMGGFIWIDAFGIILSHALIGAGATRIVMLISSFTMWCLTLPLHWFSGVYLGYGLVGIYANFFIIVIWQALIYSFLWNQEKWSRIKI